METIFKILAKFFWIILGLQIVLTGESNLIDEDMIENNHDDQNSEFLIVGGFRPENHTLHKYIVSIRLRWFFFLSEYEHICGGMPLSQNVILTAAHCLYIGTILGIKIPIFRINLLIVAGTPYTDRKIDSERSYKVEKMFPHRDYSSWTLKNDIGLIFLDRNIEVDGITISYVPLITTEPKPGMECIAFGWGGVLLDGPYPTELIYVNLTILKGSEPTCTKIVEKNPHYLCVGDENKEKGAMSGDSGGPLICNGELAGIASFVGLLYKAPSFYTNVYHYKSWIEENNANRLYICNFVIIVVNIFIVILIL